MVCLGVKLQGKLVETQKIALKKRFTDLWKIKSCPICPEKINYDYNREIFKASTECCCLLFCCKKRGCL